MSEPPAIGAILKALELMKLQQVLDRNPLLQSLERQLADLDSQRDRVKKGRAKFEKSLKE